MPVEQQDEDRVALIAREAARTRAMERTATELREQFEEALDFLREWSEERDGKVVGTYVCPGDGFVEVLVFVPGEEYDSDFDDEMTDLDLELVRRFDWISAEVMHLPAAAWEGHPSIQRAICVYGDGNTARPAGE